MALPPADRTPLITRAALRLCLALGWAPAREFRLPDGRRVDILALRPDGGFAAIEVKSCARDFLADAKWPDYRAWCDALFFAVDVDFPQEILPADAGLIVSAEGGAAILRQAPAHPLPSGSAAAPSPAASPPPPRCGWRAWRIRPGWRCWRQR